MNLNRILHIYIDWSNGVQYSYDHTDKFYTKDSNGNNITWVNYHLNKPSESECETRRCEWCSKAIYSSSSSLYEYPNNVVDQLSSLMGLLFAGLMGQSFNSEYIDLKNHRIRMIWKQDCKYEGPEGFCSLKCKSEHSYNKD